MQKGSEKIGSEYILEVVSTEGGSKNQKLYFHCIICNFDGREEKIDEHKIAEFHRFRFLELHYPTLAAIIKTRNLRSTSSLRSLLTWIFNSIYEHYKKHTWNSPQVNLDLYITKDEDINAEILNKPHPYNRSDSFIGTLGKLIEKEFPPNMENEEPNIIEIMKTSDSPESEQNDTFQNMLSERMMNESSKIKKKYARYSKNPMAHPEYISEWREFYLNYSYLFASVASINEKYYNYIYDFHDHFAKHLEMRKHAEIYQKQKEIEALLKDNIMLEDISSGEDYDIKIIEKRIETVEVSSGEEEAESMEPPTKKQKTDDSPIPTHLVLRAIQIAYKLIHRGEKPTVQGIKRALDFKVDRSSLTREFYDRHINDSGFETWEEKSPSFISFSPTRKDRNNKSF